MSESNNTPNPTAEKITRFGQIAKEKGSVAASFAKRRPVLTGLVAAACLATGYYVTREKTVSLNSLTPAYAAPSPGMGQPMKLQVTNQKGEASFTVASARLTTGQSGPKLLLNDARDFRQARQTVVIDLAKCPQYAPPGGNATAYLGKHVTAKGTLGSYDGRPQVIVDDPDGVTIK